MGDNVWIGANVIVLPGVTIGNGTVIGAGSIISIAIMSGNFVMRGQPAIYNKFIRTRMALNAVDLVIELPAVAALSAGQYFAETAVQ
ncbi:hypothetical protein EN816_40065, partial [Mesorhizobium sp. M8A.F.Ca.ET.173.01.1.1]